jgi:hypothetical protein
MRYAIAALPLLVVVGIGAIKLVGEYPRSWATVIPTAESPQLAVQRALDAITDNGTPLAGKNVPLARYVQTDGRKSDVSLVEGDFFPTVIQPSNTWSKVVKRHGLLVGSFDEKRTGKGPLSEAITVGCSVHESDITLQLGKASILPCKGPYHSGGHFDWVAVLTPVTWNSDSREMEMRACWERYGLAGNDGKTACAARAVKDSLSDLFDELQESKYNNVDTVVIPAIGTGIGQLTKANFYHTLFIDVLVDDLGKGKLIPEHIGLEVTRFEDPNKWPDTKAAVSREIGSSVNAWKYDFEHKHGDSEWLSLFGVACGGLVALVIGAFARPTSWLMESVDILTGKKQILKVILWASIAVGAVSLFKSFFSLFPAGLNPYAQIAAGFFAAMFVGPLLRMNDLVQNALSPKVQPQNVSTDGGEQ